MSAVCLLAVASAGHDSDVVPTVLLALAFPIVCAKLAGELFERLVQPAVVGELLVGIAAGNAALLGGPDLPALACSETLTVLAELGAVLLQFHVGVESTPKEMMTVGGRAAGFHRSKQVVHVGKGGEDAPDVVFVQGLRADLGHDVSLAPAPTLP